MQSGTTNVYQSSTFGNGEIVYVFATEGGCTVYDSLIMDIKPFPNAFTPDANGKNDVFLKGLDLQIANRWGELLYEGKEGWDGTFNGKTVSPGTYYYIVKLTDIDNNIKTYTGSVTLIDKTK
jgi:gliding motility-associated-like protein